MEMAVADSSVYTDSGGISYYRSHLLSENTKGMSHPIRRSPTRGENHVIEGMPRRMNQFGKRDKTGAAICCKVLFFSSEILQGMEGERFTYEIGMDKQPDCYSVRSETPDLHQ